MNDIIKLLEDVSTLFDDHEYLGTHFEVSDTFSIGTEEMYS